MSVKEKPEQKDIHSLPWELLLKIFAHLGPKELCTCTRLCSGLNTLFKEVAESDELWVEAFKKRWGLNKVTRSRQIINYTECKNWKHKYKLVEHLCRLCWELTSIGYAPSHCVFLKNFKLVTMLNETSTVYEWSITDDNQVQIGDAIFHVSTTHSWGWSLKNKDKTYSSVKWTEEYTVDTGRSILNVMSEEPCFLQYMTWLYSPDDTEYRDYETLINQFLTMNPELFISKNRFNQQLKDLVSAFRTVMMREHAPCCWRIASKDPESALRLCEFFNDFDLKSPILFLPSCQISTETVQKCLEAYHFVGFSTTFQATQNFALFSTLYWFGPWNGFERNILKLQDLGIAVPRYVFSDDLTSDLTMDEWISGAIDEISIFCEKHEENSRLCILVAFSVNDNPNCDKVKTIIDLKQKRGWKNKILVYCIDGDLSPGIISELAHLSECVNSLEDIVSYFKHDNAES